MQPTDLQPALVLYTQTVDATRCWGHLSLDSRQGPVQTPEQWSDSCTPTRQSKQQQVEKTQGGARDAARGQSSACLWPTFDTQLCTERAGGAGERHNARLMAEWLRACPALQRTQVSPAPEGAGAPGPHPHRNKNQQSFKVSCSGTSL